MVVCVCESFAQLVLDTERGNIWNLVLKRKHEFQIVVEVEKLPTEKIDIKTANCICKCVP